MRKKWEPWREVRDILGCSHQRAKKIIDAGRGALPYPRIHSSDFYGEQYGSDKAVIAALRVSEEGW